MVFQYRNELQLAVVQGGQDLTQNRMLHTATFVVQHKLN